ncbi:hypothetical protein S40293_00889 [Stachybotrys chartarum IBT 40293]|nr:hypothetical protein S40293_00889 [Stachybotrys chartarum IBT 40293]
MPNWRDEYLSSFKDAELQNPVNLDLVQICSQMADRISALEAEKAVLEGHVSRASKAKTSSGSVDASKQDAALAPVRLELAEAIRAKGVAEARLRTAEDELDKLRTRTKGDSKSMRELNSEVNSLTRRLKDQDHELREKRKLLEQVQDEIIALEIQVSMAEKERDKVKKENKELVDRWMKRMAQEADAMNLANEPLFDRSR